MRNSTLGLTALLGCLLLGGCDKLNSPPKTSLAPNGMQTEAPTQTQENAYSRLTRRVNGALVADPWRLENEEQQDRKSTRLNSSHSGQSRMPSSA